MRKKLYLLLAIAGLILPYYFFISFLTANGPDSRAFLDQLFGTKVSSFFASDLLISAVVFLVYLRPEARRHGVKRSWLYLIATLLIGLSFAFPLFLYVCESSSEQSAGRAGQISGVAGSRSRKQERP